MSLTLEKLGTEEAIYNDWIYIAGPMRGIKDFNFPAFYEAERIVETLFPAVCIFNPARRDEEHYDPEVTKSETGDQAEADAKGFDLRDALATDLDWIARHATLILLLPGWQTSKGAQAEVACARALNIEVAELVNGDILYANARTDELSASGEVRISNALTGGQKGQKPARFELIPKDPLWQLAELYGRGSKKYEDRNWEKGYDWSLSFASLQRHAWLFWGGQDHDSHTPDCAPNCLEHTEAHHLASVAWHAFAMMEWAKTHPELDNRP